MSVCGNQSLQHIVPRYHELSHCSRALPYADLACSARRSFSKMTIGSFASRAPGATPSFMSKTGRYGFKTEWFSESIRLTACDDFPAIHPRPLLGATASKVLRCSTKSTRKSLNWRLGSRLNWGNSIVQSYSLLCLRSL